MSKKWKIKLAVFMLLFLVFCTACSVESQAAKKKNKNKVSWKLKKGTLTVYGKGSMKYAIGLKKKQMKKVKKVVIKRGVTTISNYAFKGMRNLKTVKITSTVKKIGDECFAKTAIKKLTIPPSVRKIGRDAFYSSKLKNLTLPGDFKYNPEDYDWAYQVAGNISGNNNLVVTFNTKLKIENTSLFVAKGYVVSKKDSRYCSIDGSIYTKDKKTLVRVPMRMKKLKIAESCTEFCLQSVFHGVYGDGALETTCNVSEIEIPASVKTIESKKYLQKTRSSGVVPDIKKLIIRTKQLDGRSLAALVYDLEVDAKVLMEQLPEQIYYRNGKYFSRDGVWLKPYPRKGECK